MRDVPKLLLQFVRHFTLTSSMADTIIVRAIDASPRAASALGNLPPFPQVAAKVPELLRTEPGSFRLIADTLKTDAALSAEVLRPTHLYSKLVATSAA